MKALRRTLTTDANGDGNVKVKLGFPLIFANLRAYFVAARREFFRVYVTIEEGDVFEDIGGGSSGSGGAGGSGATMRSVPKMETGKYVEANQAVRVYVEAGAAHASVDCVIMFDWEQVMLSG